MSNSNIPISMPPNRIRDDFHDNLPKTFNKFKKAMCGKYTSCLSYKGTTGKRKDCIKSVFIEILKIPLQVPIVGVNAIKTLSKTFSLFVATVKLPFNFQKNKANWQSTALKVVDLTLLTITSPLSPVLTAFRAAIGIIKPSIYLKNEPINNNDKLEMYEISFLEVKELDTDEGIDHDKDSIATATFFYGLYDYSKRWGLIDPETLNLYSSLLAEHSKGAHRAKKEIERERSDKVSQKYDLLIAFDVFNTADNFNSTQLEEFLIQNFKTDRQKKVLSLFLGLEHTNLIDKNRDKIWNNSNNLNYVQELKNNFTYDPTLEPPTYVEDEVKTKEANEIKEQLLVLLQRFTSKAGKLREHLKN